MAKKKRAKQPRLKLGPLDPPAAPQAPIAIEEVLEELEPRQKQVINEWIAYAFSGPLPPPQTVAGYDQVITDGANRIMEMAEREQSHTHEQEKAHSARLDTLVNLDAKLALRGQAIGAALMIVLIAAALVFAYLEKFPQALGTVLSAVAVQVGSWALNRASRQHRASQQNSKSEENKK